MARKLKPRKLKTTVAIVGEGITEQIYFSHIKSSKEFSFDIKPELPKHSAVKDLVKKAEELSKKEYDKVIVIFDLDTIKSAEKSDYDSFCSKCARAGSKISVASVNPCFELWFKLHFLYTDRHFPDGDTMKREMRNHFPGYTTTKEFLSKPSFYETLTSVGSRDDAMSNSKRVSDDRDSVSLCEVYQVFETLEAVEKENRK